MWKNFKSLAANNWRVCLKTFSVSENKLAPKVLNGIMMVLPANLTLEKVENSNISRYETETTFQII